MGHFYQFLPAAGDVFHILRVNPGNNFNGPVLDAPEPPAVLGVAQPMGEPVPAAPQTIER